MTCVKKGIGDFLVAICPLVKTDTPLGDEKTF